MLFGVAPVAYQGAGVALSPCRPFWREKLHACAAAAAAAAAADVGRGSLRRCRERRR